MTYTVTYAKICLFVAILGVFILAHTALKYLRTSVILRQICKGLIVINFRLRGRLISNDEAEAELARLIEEFEEGD